MFELIGRAAAQNALPTITFFPTETNFETLIPALLNWVLTIVAAVAVIFLVYGGIQYITAGGDAEKATKGRTTIVNAIIGIVILALAFAIVNYIGTAISGNS